ncbi:MAG: hypothetical protein IJI36_10605 [Kiritimatiellae bacterium]|nr:hypothetical protein [Kiritimatiellia bacterium]
MKNVSFLAICLACVATLGAADLSDLMVREPVNPDDVMLRRPAGRTRAELDARAKAAAAAAEAQAKAQAEAEAKARAEAEARAKEDAAKAQAEAEAKARAEAEAKAKEEAAKAQAEAEAKARAEAEAKAQAEAEAKAKDDAAKADAKAREEEAAKVAAEKAKVEAELQALREQVAREKEARKEIEGKAAMDRMAAERAAAQAVSDRVAAEKAAAQAAADRAAAEKATEAKAAAEKRISYLQNPDPDERPKPKKLEAPAEQQDVTETVPGPEKKSRKHRKAKGEKGASGRTGRDAVITSERTDYDRKEGVILFDRNVFVDDELYQMHADRLFVFLDGTNDLKRIVAIGNVSITNEQRTASCSRAVFTKAASKIVMYGDETSNAKLEDPSQRGGVAEGKKITFWLDAEQVSVEGSAVSLPGGMLKGRDPKKFLEGAK